MHRGRAAPVRHLHGLACLPAGQSAGGHSQRARAAGAVMGLALLLLLAPLASYAHLLVSVAVSTGWLARMAAGDDFKAAISHESKTFFFVTMGKSNVLLYQCG